MIKKITFILVLLCFTISCGKKGNPEFKASQKKNENSKKIIQLT